MPTITASLALSSYKVFMPNSNVGLNLLHKTFLRSEIYSSDFAVLCIFVLSTIDSCTVGFPFQLVFHGYFMFPIFKSKKPVSFY